MMEENTDNKTLDYFDDPFFTKPAARHTCAYAPCLFGGIKIFSKSILAFGSGHLVSIGLRLLLYAAQKSEPAWKPSDQNTELGVTDGVGYLVSIVVCSILTLPVLSRRNATLRSPRLLLRTTLRAMMPCLFLLPLFVSLLFAKPLYAVCEIPDPLWQVDGQRILQVSDFLPGSFCFLLVWHIADRLLERFCCTSDPYKGTRLDTGTDLENITLLGANAFGDANRDIELEEEAAITVGQSHIQ